ncbi:MAG TPA: serine/threonine-protein kinase [Baekduia sp.]|uniref:serine/threonine-protein kinase n=1 Tax=Baekduia sp. TaxID=2600305 RepID=UPI002D76C590|nr:serine/threonine-protein kinase [Baekduia sp.]HET6506263.1 serine/threonine-protein kinase [Baekduia sp.]
MVETVEVTADLISDGLGAFDELEFLGRGTFGTTFRALRGESETAIKVIHLVDMPAYLWERELTSLATVDHPNVVGLIGSGTFKALGRELSFLECEYVSGGSVEARVRTGERPRKDELRALLTGLLAGIAEIHDLGIIHRDIKPANVGLRDGEWGSPVLLDFGVAKVLDMTSHTAVGQMVGTAPYMAPEQLRGRPARTRSDLFAVGLVVYEAGTGRHPFRSPDVQTVQSLYDRITSGPPEDPRVSADWPDDVAEVVLRILSAEPHERLSVARALKDLGAR